MQTKTNKVMVVSESDFQQISKSRVACNKPGISCDSLLLFYIIGLFCAIMKPSSMACLACVSSGKHCRKWTLGF